MTFRAIAVVAFLAIVLAGSAVAGSLAQEPGALMLRKSDFPTRAKYDSGRLPTSFTQGLAALGVRADGAYFAVTIPVSGATKYQSVSGVVVTAANAAQARTAYGAFKADLERRNTSVLRLPAYGDEQLALLTSPNVGSKAEMLVRRNRVVWQLELGGGGLLVIQKATLLAELGKYAARQRTRIGRG